MNPGLLALIGQAAAPGAVVIPTNTSPDDLPETDTITVGSGVSEPPLMGNRQYQEEAMAANEHVPDRSGMFGVRGTLRDILGLVGDSFLMQQGHDPYYQPIRRQERLSDAMLGFTAGNEGALSAAERVTAMGDTDLGRQLAEQAQAQAADAAAAEAQAASARSVEAGRVATRADRGRENIARLLATPGAFENGVITPDAYRLAQMFAQSEGVSLEDYGISPQMTAGQGGLFSGSDASVYQSWNQPLRERDVATRERNARTAESRPGPQPRQPRAPTTNEIALEIGNIPPGERTQAQRDWYQNWQEDGGARTSPRPSPRRAGVTIQRIN